MKSRGIVCLIHWDNIHIYWMCRRSLLLRITGSRMSTVVWWESDWVGWRVSAHPLLKGGSLVSEAVLAAWEQWIGAFWLECICSKGGKASPPTQPLRFGCSSGPCCLPAFFSLWDSWGLPLPVCCAAAFPTLSFTGFLLCVGKLCLWLGIKNRSISANLILPWVSWFRLFCLDVWV